jgi:hypothetical protein
MERVTAVDSAIEVRGEAELRLRTAPIYRAARFEMSCTAPDLRTWSVLQLSTDEAPAVPSWVPRVQHGFLVRKLYGPQVLLDPRSARPADRIEALGAQIRISTDPLHETILIDRRAVIMAGDPDERPRRYRVLFAPEVVHSVAALFDAAWRTAAAVGATSRFQAGLRARQLGLV